VLGLVAVAAIAAVALAVLLGRSGPPATALGDMGYTYSAKFICGTAGSADPLLPGQYSTAINVHNLQDSSVHIYKKAVLAPPESQSPGEPIVFRELDVPPDAAFEIDCPDILRLLVHPCAADVDANGAVKMNDVLLIVANLGTTNPTYDLDMDGIVDQDDVDLAIAAVGTQCPPLAPLFLKGFVVIESPVELDVWGVYTSTLSLGAPTSGNDISEDVEVVPPKRQPFPPVTPTPTPTETPTATPTPACIDRLGDTQCDDAVNDADDDGCAAAEEQAGALPPKPGSTGAYNPAAWYDFYDVPIPAKPDALGANGTRNKAVNLQDVVAVLKYVGTSVGGPQNGNGVDYDTIKGVDLNGDSVNDIMPPLHNIPEGQKYDRSPGPLPNPPYDAGPPDGTVNLQDVVMVLKQVGLDCSGPP
jgi:hypothetical protein